MKLRNLVLLCLVTSFSIVLRGQDKVVLKTGEELNVKVIKNSESVITFQYPNETLINEKNKREIRYIIFESGRREDYNYGINVPIIRSKDDWDKVIETYLESDVAGLERIGELKATSGWGGSLGSSIGYKDAIRKIKKKAAKLGAGVILIHGAPNQIAAARGGGVQIIATAYK